MLGSNMKGIEHVNLLTAQSDILCYKVFKECMPRPWYWFLFKCCDLIVPCINRKYIRGVILDTDIRILVPKHCGQKFNIGRTYKFKSGTSRVPNGAPEYIVANGLHVHQSYDDAIAYCKTMKDCHVAACTVPKGSSYYIGKFDGSVGLVANSIHIYYVI